MWWKPLCTEHWISSGVGRVCTVACCVLQLSGVIMAGRVCRCAKAEVRFLANSADAGAAACRCV